MLKLPGLIDPHVHVREPGQTHKEDWDTATQAALAGGVTMILAMPNTKPPIFDAETLNLALEAAKAKARCDYAQFVGAGPDNPEALPGIASQAAGLKMYLDSTFGELRLDDMTLWMPHFQKYPKEYPLVLHSESRTMAAGILFAAIYDRPVHIAHISLKEEVLLIKAAKERGVKVTCEVCPHHLFLSQDHISSLSGATRSTGSAVDTCPERTLPGTVRQDRCATDAHLPRMQVPWSAVEYRGERPSTAGSALRSGRSEVRPRLATKEDVDSLWANMDVIDCFATDHAPHTLAEKDSENPPPGFPGLETLLPLLLTAVHDGRLTIDQIIQKSVLNPRKIFRLPEQAETWIEVDEKAEYEIRAADQFTRCNWTPFEGWKVRGKVKKVLLRGQTAFEDGKIFVEQGYGRDVRQEQGI